MPFIGSGAPLTALNASNLASGTVPTARLGSGTANSSTFLRGDNTWASPATAGSAKAWVNFNGTGTVAMRSNFNVTSITDLGTGAYAVNFTTAMADANYASFLTTNNGGVMDAPGASNSTKTASRLDINIRANTGALEDASEINCAIFR
jgi:hypothetical protein